MDERLKKIKLRLAQMDHNVNRGHEHLLNVMASQRDRIDRAFDTLKSEVRFALLDQDVALRGELLILRAGMSDLREGLLDLTQAIGDHELRLQRLEQMEPPAA
ncbi:hypothetical protein DYH09_05720 [bacterium CPR1]|nr:hypothetical protein [bacterium CPR1]